MSPLAALLTDWAITAFWPIIGAAGTHYYSSVLFAHAGIIIGFLTLSPWLMRNGRWRAVLSPELRKPLFLMGLFGSTLPSVIYVHALRYTSPSNAAIMAQIEILYSAALCAWLLHEHISIKQVTASLLVIGGTGLIMLHDLGGVRWKGDVLILLTPWMYQVSHIQAKRLPKNLDAITLAGGRLFYGMLALVPFSVWTLMHSYRWAWTLRGCATLLAQGIGLCCLNHTLWYMAIRRMDLAKATAIMLSYPVLTTVLSWALGRETIGAYQLAGLGLAMAGAYWLSSLVLAAQRAAAVDETPAEFGTIGT